MFHFDKNYGFFVGKLTKNEFHKHYAIQLSVVDTHKMSMTANDTPHVSGDAFFVPSKLEHQLISPDVQLTVLINPLSPLGHTFQMRYGKTAVSPLQSDLKHQLIGLLSKFKTHQIKFRELCTLINNCLSDHYCNCAIENHSKDDRIITVLELFEKNFDRIYSLEKMAEISHLSPSRFLHLFKERTGLNFRRYQLWNKVIQSLPYLMNHSITDTAHTFGFTDSSHYTRTFKETFGVTPKFMFQQE